MDKKRIIMGGATLACIGAIGFVMQGGGKQVLPMAASLMGGASGASDARQPVAIAEIALTAADTELAAKPKVPVTAKAAPGAQPQAETPATEQRQPEKPAEPDMADAVPGAQKPATQAETAAPVAASAATLAPAAAASALIQMMTAPSKAAAPEPEAPTTISLLETEPGTPVAKPGKQAEPKIGDHCDITMSGTEMAGALVKLELSAPCLPNERVTLHHNGMMFTEATDDKGHLSLAVPALTEDAVFIASFANSEGAVANVNVTTLGLYDRALVQSDFTSAVGLHALEFGSGYDDTGHVWANAPGDIAGAAIGRGGFMTVLGNPAVAGGTMAEVYTFPSGLADEAGDVALSVEIEVTNMNCGHEIEAQSLEVNAGGEATTRQLNLTMPDCDAVGDFLVLKNLVNDLKVAANTQ